MIKLLTVADLLTLLNALCGFIALLMIFTTELRFAAALIFLGLIIDGLDGIVARRTRTGPLGEYLESIADMMTLSVAPLMLFYATYASHMEFEVWMNLLVGGVLVFSLLCSLIRLSSFSTMKEKSYFTGLPTSASAIFLVLLSFLSLNILPILPFIVLVSLAMISPIRFPKTGLKMDMVTTIFIVIVVLVNGIYSNIVPWLFLTALLCYIIGGPLYLYLSKKKPSNL